LVDDFSTWVLAVVDGRMPRGGLISAPVRIAADGVLVEKYAEDSGPPKAPPALEDKAVRTWPMRLLLEAAKFAEEAFYRIAGWTPTLMTRNRTIFLQAVQLARSDEEKDVGKTDMPHQLQQELALLSHCHTGDRQGALRLLNEMLAVIFMAASPLPVKQSRTTEMLSRLSRLAIECNPLLESLILKNVSWAVEIAGASSLESLSKIVAVALDDYIESVFFRGMNRSNPKVRRAIEFMSDNYRSKISLRSVAQAVDLSPCRLAHLIKEHTGKTVVQLIDEMRIRHAQRLLRQTNLKAEAIALESGFGDHSYFIKHFRRLTGTTPRKYRQS
jgi:AraC-like DNA-binding protein